MSDIEKLLADVEAAAVKQYGRALTETERDAMRKWLQGMRLLQANFETLVCDVREMRTSVQSQLEALSMLERAHPEAHTADLVRILRSQMSAFEETLQRHYEYWHPLCYGKPSRFAPTITPPEAVGARLN